jgi:hypothetical protein
MRITGQLSRSTFLQSILAGTLGIAACVSSVYAQPNGGVGAGRGAGPSRGAGAAAAPAPCVDGPLVDVDTSASGPHEVIVETRCAPGIEKGTIYRPADLGGDEKYPVFVWGNGGCSQNGLSNRAAMSEIASHGYFVIADGTPGRGASGGRMGMAQGDMTPMGEPLIAYIDWALAENENASSPYYRSLAADKISSNGFSCGGLMAIGTVGDPRITTWGVTSSGMARVNDEFYELVQTPVLFVEGGPGDVAYEGGKLGYENISQLDVPVMWFDKDLGHGGDLGQANGGQFTKIILAWLNWWLKDDLSATGKGFLVGADCVYCSDETWEVKSANLP